MSEIQAEGLSTAAPNSNDNVKNGYGAVDAGGVSARNPQTGEFQKLTEAGANVQGVDTQTGTQAKGEYTKHRFSETPDNGGHGGNAIGWNGDNG
jgi:hypothetical protein